MKGVWLNGFCGRFRYSADRPNDAVSTQAIRKYHSQGELVSMVTSEAEPMGGVMGDAVAQPRISGGHDVITCCSSFLASPWFGLAGVALIRVAA